MNGDTIMALVYEKKDKIAYLTINRPEARNAIDPETAVELAHAWTDYRDDAGMRCAIITGVGDQSFCAGADLGRLIPLLTGARKPETEADTIIQGDSQLLQNAFLRGFELSKPVIAAVNGYAIAGGFELLYGADIRVASLDAKFGLQEVKWSVFPAGGSTVLLPRQLPHAKAMEILLTGELMDAHEAFRLGFVNKIVPAGMVMEEAERYANIIIKNGPLAISGIKKAVHAISGMSIKEGMAKELELAIPVFLSEDAKEGPRAFKQKREPVFKGK
jgi:enoyl-CoA hydratase